MSIREGFEWTEVEPPVRCVLQIDREIDRQAGRNRRKERQRDRAVSLFIDSHVCMDESLSVPRAGPHAVFRPQHD